jgi:hypothetical protein
MHPDVTSIAESLNALISERGLHLPAEYHYSSLVFCVTDAVFSIGVRYESVQRVVRNLARFLGLSQVYRSPDEIELTLSDFMGAMSSWTADSMAQSVFNNKCRTSTRNGILKAEAVLKFSEGLIESGINSFADLTPSRLEVAGVKIRSIKGQKSGVSFKYFCMLAGLDHLIKPDRMVCRYVQDTLGLPREVSPSFAEQMILESLELLRANRPSISAREVDYVIWEFQRGRAT